MTVADSSDHTYERLRVNLERLKLGGISETLDGVLEQSFKEGWSAVELLDQLMDREWTRREEISRVTRLKLSGFPFQKRLDDFDFNFQPSIPRDVIRDLQTLRFVHNRENVILLGPPGVGKTHLAIALGMEAIHAGMSVYYTNTATMIDKLLNAALNGELERKMKTYRKPNVLMIDELGYLPLGKEGAHIFFQVISKLYQEKSVIITSNKAFGEWGDVFGDNAVAAAILDRVFASLHGDQHPGGILAIEGAPPGAQPVAVDCGGVGKEGLSEPVPGAGGRSPPLPPSCESNRKKGSEGVGDDHFLCIIMGSPRAAVLGKSRAVFWGIRDDF